MTAPPLRRHVVEVDEEHALAAAVLGSCKQIVNVAEPGLAGERRREVGELDRNDRIDLDLAGWQRVAASGLDMRAYPDPYAARDLPAAHAIAELLRELHCGPRFARFSARSITELIDLQTGAGRCGSRPRPRTAERDM